MRTLACRVCAVVIMALPQLLSAEVRVWTGGGSDANWSTPENWGGSDSSVIPANGDIVLLSGTEGKGVVVNDIENLTLRGLSFTGTRSFEFTGKALSLNGFFSNEVAVVQLTNSVALSFAAEGTISFAGNLCFNAGVTNHSGKVMTVRCTVPNKNYHLYFNAPFYAPDSNLSLRGHKTSGYIHFCDELNVKSMQGDAQNTAAAAGEVHLETDNAVFGTVTMNMNALVGAVKNAFDPDGVIYWFGATQSGRSFIDLGGYDQTIGRMYMDLAEKHRGNREVKSSGKALLFVNAAQSSVVDCAFKGKAGICFDPASEDVSFKITNCVSTTSGDIVVSNGIFEVASGASFKNVGAIEVSDGAEFVLSSSEADALGDGTVVLRLDSGSRMTLPEGYVLRVAALYVDSERFEGGRYTASSLAQLSDNGSAIILPDYEREGVSFTWNGAGGDASVFAPSNWEGDAAPNLQDGTAAAVFASAGDLAEIPSGISMYSLEFVRDFVLSGEGLLKLYGGSVSLGENCKATIAVPVEIRKTHSFNLSSGAELTLASSVTSPDWLECGITKYGNSGNMVFRNARIDCAFTLENGNGGFMVTGGGETVFAGAFVLKSYISFKPALKEASTVVFEGGLTWGSAYFQLQDGTESNKGNWIFRNKPLVCNGSGPLQIATHQTLQFAARDNRLYSLDMKGTASRVVCACDYAFSNYYTRVTFNNHNNTATVLDLGGYDQEFADICMTKKPDKTQSMPSICSGAPARLAFSQSTDQVNTRVSFDGQIDLEKRGPASVVFSRSYDATGTVTVVEGALKFDADSSALNVTNVAVRGGVFSIAKSKTLPKAVSIEISDGAGACFDIADGVKQRCKALFVGGKKMPSGTYGSATSPAKWAGDEVAQYFTGNGVLSVCGNMTIILR